MAFLLAAITCAVFAPALGYDFINYDDTIYAYQNPHLLGGLNFASVDYAFHTTDGGSWMPLTWISSLLVITLFGVNAAAQHALNILLHAGSAAVLFLALARMTKCFWRSALVAALFALHPLRSESVVWVAERKDTLSTLFWMLGLLAYARHAEKPGPRRLALVFVCLLLGLMAKPMLVTFPFALLLLDHWPLGRAGKNWPEIRANFWLLVREKIPLLLLCGLVAAGAFWAQKHGGAVVSVASTPTLKFLRVSENYLFYLQKIFWPADLSILYPTNPLRFWLAVLAGLGIVSLVGLSFRWAFRFPWLLTGWLWFLGTFAPVIGVVRLGHIIVADRYTYIPSVGLAILLAWTAGLCVELRPRLRPVGVCLSGLLLLSCVFATRADLPRWKNTITIFQSSLSRDENEIALHNLALAYHDRGEFNRALTNLNRAITLDPERAEVYASRAATEQALGDRTHALADLNQAIQLKPTAPEPLVNRGSLYFGAGDYDRAIADFTAVIRIDPDHVKAWNNRAAALNSQGHFAAAIADCQQAIRLNPLYAEAFSNLGNAQAGLGDLAAAFTAYNRAIELAPSLPATYNNRAGIYYQARKFDEAWADIRRCRQLGGQPNAVLVRDLAAASGHSE